MTATDITTETSSLWTNNVFSSTGRLVYDKKKEPLLDYACIYTSNSLSRYYQKFLQRSLGLNSINEVYRSHITVINHNEIVPPELWGKYQNEIIEFNYSIEVKSAGPYFWLPVVSTRVTEIRAEMGLPATPPMPLHLTLWKAGRERKIKVENIIKLPWENNY